MDDHMMIRAVLAFGERCPKFDTTFVKDLKEYYEENEELTDRQRDALKNIIHKWRITWY
jgi:hypothetical protein